MAAAVVSPASFNIKTQAAYPIILGDTLSESSDTQQFAGVRYNFKPQTKSTRSFDTHINTVNDDGELELSFEDDDSTYEYSGRDFRDEESFVLVVKRQGKDHEMVLERIGHCYGFDITKENGAKPSKRYPPLPLADDEENGDDLFGDEDEEAPVNDDNPFDYRHFLKAELDKLEVNKINGNGNASSTGTPSIRAGPSKPAANKQVKRTEPKKTSTTTKRKSAATEKPNPKRVKAGPEPQVQAEAVKPKLPEVRVDRRASARRPSLDDSDELILENETPADDRPRKPTSAMVMAMSGQLGPISLRSAASSPGSRVESPFPQRPSGMEEEYTFDLGDSSPDASAHEAEAEADGEDEEDDADDDADVPDFDLPSPKNPAVRRPGDGETAPMPPPPTDEDYEDDEFSKQLAEAMAADDGAGLGMTFGNDDSDEESEEE